MDLSRRAPHIVAALFAWRVLACGDSNESQAPSVTTGNDAAVGQGGSSSGSGSGTSSSTGTSSSSGTSSGTTGTTGGGGDPGATCSGNILTYQAALPNGTFETRTHTCSGGCSPSSPGAVVGAAVCTWKDGEIPFWLCKTGFDCRSTNYCVNATATSRVLLDSGDCFESVCDWKTKTTVGCPGQSMCSSAECRYNSTGVTSGGFPWAAGGSGGTGNIEAGTD